MTAVHQFVPSFAARDAIGAHTLEVQKVLLGLGFESEIFVADVHPDVASLTRHYREFFGARPGERVWLLYQASTGSTIARFLLDRPEPKLVDYHNVTPARFFDAWEPEVAAELTIGRAQVAELAPETQLGLADSEFNRRDLVALGYTDTVVAPVLVDVDAFAETDDDTLAKLVAEKQPGGADWLFVGRVAPHKAQHDLVKAFLAYRRAFDPAARLHVVGGSSSHRYLSALESFAHAVGADESIRWHGSISTGALAAHYRAADVFVCLSQHEGFCVPLLESMHHRVPVVALRNSAVPETLGDAGVLLPSARPTVVATAVQQILHDDALRTELVEAGTRRLERFSLDVTRARFTEVIRGLLGEAG